MHLLDQDALRQLLAQVAQLRLDLLRAEEDEASAIAAVHQQHHRSARNLVHYVELRRHDLRQLQGQLSTLGLSSLGRSEPNVLATVEAVMRALSSLAGDDAPAGVADVAIGEGELILEANAARLLGTLPPGRSTRIMVTLPSEAATDPVMVIDLVSAGMDIGRINCAHDDTEAWLLMTQRCRSATAAGHRPVLIAMDLGGPKLRTGPLQSGPAVRKVRPHRDALGTVERPAFIWLHAVGESAPSLSLPADVGPVVPLPVQDPAWLSRRSVGDAVHVLDSRGATRRWVVERTAERGCLLLSTKSTYFATGTHLLAEAADGDTNADDPTTIAALPNTEQVHRVDHGDLVVLTRSMEPAAVVPGGPHRIGCTLPEVFSAALPGERLWLDDGKIGGTIVEVTPDELTITVTDVRPGGAKLRAGKGINLPDTDLRLDALTAKDLQDLPFVAAHGDAVSLSFVRSPRDVELLQAHLQRLDADGLGIILKIENVAAFRHLPALLLTALRSTRVGVMIARGDLAVEVGFERLAEVQEEIMWACEAAHVPVIWATQVLDTLARTGQPSRAEVTDAAMADRAECVMLNKGPHINEAIRALSSILGRMQHHQDKKRSLLRRLRSWSD